MGHTYLCLSCGVPVAIVLNHVGCGMPGCPGTFQHPDGRCQLAGRTLRHREVRKDVRNGHA